MTFQPPPEPPLPIAAETNSAVAASNQAARAAAMAQKQKTAEDADALNKRISRWTFLMSSATLDSLLPDRAGLLKKPEAPTPDTATVSGPEAAVGIPAGQGATESGGSAAPPR